MAKGTSDKSALRSLFQAGEFVAAPGVFDLLSAKLADPHFTTELGQFQLEANADPQYFTGDGLARMEAQPVGGAVEDVAIRTHEAPLAFLSALRRSSS